MKKIILLLLLPFLSCKEYKAIVAETTLNYKNSKLFFVDKQKDILEVSLNGVSHSLFFDTGAGATVIYNPKFTINERRIVKNRSVYGFNKKTKTTLGTYSLDTMTSGIFKIHSKYLYLSKKPESLCSIKESFDGILGSFFDWEASLELNYEEGYVKFTDEKPNLDYIELPCKFTYSGKFYIELAVNGVRDQFLFDTGNKTTIILNSKLYHILPAKEYTIRNIAQTVAGPVQVELDIHRANFKMSDQLEFEFPVAIDHSSKRSILNDSFIKKFNWIIDPKNEKVYCKPIDKTWLTSKKTLRTKVDKILCSESNKRLLISYINFETSAYNINDQITAVNNTSVTTDNICEIQSLINQTADWNTLNLEIIPAKH